MEFNLQSMFGIDGKVVAVTGGAGGIGGGLAENLCRLGARVAIIDMNQEAMDARVADIREKVPGADVRTYQTDITNVESVEKTFEGIYNDFGSVYGLVNCAGISHVTWLSEMDIEAWQKVMDVNVRGTVLCTKIAGRYMDKEGVGRIINISSLASTHGKPKYTAYTPSKSAVDGFTFTLAAEWGLKGITVNAIAPVLVVTGINRHQWNDDNLQLAKEGNPQGRICSPDLLTGLLVFLLSESSSYVNGQVIGCDGGSTRGDIGMIKPQNFEKVFGHSGDVMR